MAAGGRQKGQALAKSSRDFIYGLNPAFEVIRAGRRRVFNAYLAEAGKSPRLKKLADYLERMEIPAEWVDRGRLHQLCGSGEHQGVVLRAELYPYAERSELYVVPRLLLMDNVEDPHNVGAILRSAEVFGFHHVCLPTKGVPEVYPSVVKVSAGAVEHMKIARGTSAIGYVKEAQEAGYHIAALDAAGKMDLEELASARPEKLMLVIGGEDRSVGQFILNNADSVVGIPQSGKVNSLNASVAAGIAMYRLRGTGS